MLFTIVCLFEFAVIGPFCWLSQTLLSNTDLFLHPCCNYRLCILKLRTYNVHIFLKACLEFACYNVLRFQSFLFREKQPSLYLRCFRVRHSCVHSWKITRSIQSNFLPVRVISLETLSIASTASAPSSQASMKNFSGVVCLREDKENI